MINNGALMSLAVFGNTNKNICTQSQRTGHFTEILLTYDQLSHKYTHKLSNKKTDITTFEYIVIDFSNISNNNIDQILNNLGDFVFRVGEVDLIRIRFDLLHKLDCSMKINKLTVKIPFTALIKEINMIGLSYIQKYLFIETKADPLVQTNIKVMCYDIYCEGAERQMLYKHPYRIPVQFFHSHDIKSIDNQPSTSLIHKLNSYSISKGYLFDGNIDQINNIQLQINGLIFIDYNLDMINIACTKINKKILYMPLHNSSAYDSLNVDDYTYGVNNDRIDDLKLIINFNIPQTMISVHSININIFTYASMHSKMYLCEKDDENIFKATANNYALANVFHFHDDYWHTISNNPNIIDLIDNNKLDYVFDHNLQEIWSNYLEHHKQQMMSLMNDVVDNNVAANNSTHINENDVKEDNYVNFNDIIIDL